MDNLLSIGDCISVAIRRCRKDLSILIRKLMLPSAVEMVGKVFLLYGARVFLSSLQQGSGENYSNGINAGLLGFAICLPAEIWLTMIQLAYVRMIVLQEESYETSFAKTWPKFWCVILYAIGFYLLLIAWVVVCVAAFAIATVLAKLSPVIALIMIPVLLLMVVMTIVSLVLLVMPVSLLFVVLACEDSGFFAVLGRSIKLTFQRFGATFLFICALIASWLTLYTAMTSVLQIMYFVEYQRLGAGHVHKLASEIQLPMQLQMLGGFWNSVVYMYLMPVLFLATGYYYYSIRARQEGLDLTYRASKMIESAQSSQ